MYLSNSWLKTKLNYNVKPFDNNKEINTSTRENKYKRKLLQQSPPKFDDDFEALWDEPPCDDNNDIKHPNDYNNNVDYSLPLITRKKRNHKGEWITPSNNNDILEEKESIIENASTSNMPQNLKVVDKFTSNNIEPIIEYCDDYDHYESSGQEVSLEKWKHILENNNDNNSETKDEICENNEINHNKLFNKHCFNIITIKNEQYGQEQSTSHDLLKSLTSNILSNNLTSSSIGLLPSIGRIFYYSDKNELTEINNATMYNIILSNNFMFGRYFTLRIWEKSSHSIDALQSHHLFWNDTVRKGSTQFKPSKMLLSASVETIVDIIASNSNQYTPLRIPRKGENIKQLQCLKKVAYNNNVANESNNTPNNDESYEKIDNVHFSMSSRFLIGYNMLDYFKCKESNIIIEKENITNNNNDEMLYHKWIFNQSNKWTPISRYDNPSLPIIKATTSRLPINLISTQYNPSFVSDIDDYKDIPLTQPFNISKCFIFFTSNDMIIPNDI